jgi:hypothetical protein
MERVFEQNGGVDTDNTKFCSVANLSAAGAQKVYERAVRKLLNVNNWAEHIGIPGQDFQLVSNGAEKSGQAALGDYIRIKLPADPTFRSYWVKIEKADIKESANSKSTTIVVRPAAKPGREDESITDHFFTNEATNTFRVTLDERSKTLTAQVSGRDEYANTYQAATTLDGMANSTIANMGWSLGFQAQVWSNLNKKIVNCEI